MSTLLTTFLLSCCLLSCALNKKSHTPYPSEWWIEISKTEAKGWEILPQDANPGEVILSKRTELGIFSNLAFSPFILDDVKYNSIEGLWQGMKYPDENLANDPRLKFTNWPHKRAAVFLLSGWSSKEAGNHANKIYKDKNFLWINYKDHKFNYTDQAEGSKFHLELITRATKEKINQNEEIKKLLIKTRGLILKPDHNIDDSYPPSYKYHEILMKIRDELP